MTEKGLFEKLREKSFLAGDMFWSNKNIRLGEELIRLADAVKICKDLYIKEEEMQPNEEKLLFEKCPKSWEKFLQEFFGEQKTVLIVGHRIRHARNYRGHLRATFVNMSRTHRFNL